MAGQRQKAPQDLVNTRGGRVKQLTVIPQIARQIPTVQKGLGPEARRVWRKFFSSWVAAAVEWEADYERLRWWIRCVDRRHKLATIVADTPLVRGSHGQLMNNPLERTIARLTRDIERTEEQFGMTSMSRFRLQLTATEARRSANDLRRELMEPGRDERPDDDDIIDLGDLEDSDSDSTAIRTAIPLRQVDSDPTAIRQRFDSDSDSDSLETSRQRSDS